MGRYLLLIRQLVPHAGQESRELAVGEVRTLLLQFRTLLLREDEHGGDGPFGFLWIGLQITERVNIPEEHKSVKVTDHRSNNDVSVNRTG